MPVSEVFLSLIVTSVIGLVGVSLRICYKSKCSEVNCCCFKIKRDTQAETQEEQFRITHHIPVEGEHPPTPQSINRSKSVDTMV